MPRCRPSADSRAVLAVLAALVVVGAGGGCRPARPAAATPAGRLEAALTYGGGLGQPYGVRLWEDGPRVRAVAFGGARLAARDTARLRAALGALAALAAAPPDTVAQDSAGTTWLCADRVAASVRVRRGGHERQVADARCRRSPAEARYRRTADSVYAGLTTPRGE